MIDAFVFWIMKPIAEIFLFCAFVFVVALIIGPDKKPDKRNND
jgi:hypothetical protein